MKKILIVEDEANLREILKMNLEKSGFECLTAEDGLEALKITNVKKPDLVILDLRISKVPGKEVCKKIKSDQETSTIPIIMLTGKNSDVDRIVGKVVGADCYLNKPCDMPTLLENINKLLGEKDGRIE
ncbi:MAG: response regulator [Candidatus Omnitrophica bacterium]|nr:response regulator [Candidatus Omnitrophota bacterium]